MAWIGLVSNERGFDLRGVDFPFKKQFSDKNAIVCGCKDVDMKQYAIGM